MIIACEKLILTRCFEWNADVKCVGVGGYLSVINSS